MRSQAASCEAAAARSRSVTCAAAELHVHLDGEPRKRVGQRPGQASRQRRVRGAASVQRPFRRSARAAAAWASAPSRVRGRGVASPRARVPPARGVPPPRGRRPRRRGASAARWPGPTSLDRRSGAAASAAATKVASAATASSSQCVRHVPARRAPSAATGSSRGSSASAASASCRHPFHAVGAQRGPDERDPGTGGGAAVGQRVLAACALGVLEPAAPPRRPPAQRVDPRAEGRDPRIRVERHLDGELLEPPLDRSVAGPEPGRPIAVRIRAARSPSPEASA